MGGSIVFGYIDADDDDDDDDEFIRIGYGLISCQLHLFNLDVYFVCGIPRQISPWMLIDCK